MFFVLEGARVPHRLCIKGWHPPWEGVTGATRVLHDTHPKPETHPSLCLKERDLPQPLPFGDLCHDSAMPK